MKINLLRITLLLLTFLFVTGNLYSQQDDKPKKTAEEIATRMADKFKERFSLSEDQYGQIYKLALSQAQIRINNKEQYKSMDKKSRKQMKKQSRDEFRKQLEGVLSKEQLEKMKLSKGKHEHKKGDKKKNKKEKR